MGIGTRVNGRRDQGPAIRAKRSSDGASATVLFLSNNFPPEVNALATRTWEHTRAWASAGGDVEVISGPPHFPEGEVHAGYRNAFHQENVEGVRVTRIPMYVTPNRGLVRRSISYLSYLLSAAWFATRAIHEPPPGVVVASSPHLLAGLAGWVVSSRIRRPFVLEVRDLWPKSIVEVGAMERNLLIRALESLERFLYRRADHVVIVSPAFREHVEARGVAPSDISVLPNGVDYEWLARSPSADGVEALKRALGLSGRFVVSYIGTVGLAHGLDVLVEAARLCDDPEIVFLVVGAGADWDRLSEQSRKNELQNLVVLERQPRERVRDFYALTDVSVVHLLDRPAFREVIPSKMFESMAMERPIVLGVRGIARRILEQAGAGVAVPPGDARALLAAVSRLKADPALRSAQGAAGAACVAESYDRGEIARRYWDVLQAVAMSG